MPHEKKVRSILNKTRRRDAWFLDDYTLNLYQACSFNCLYCYIRGSRYGLNLENSLTVKINAIEVLERQLALRAKKGEYGFIVLSSVTDPYLHVEKRYELTRKALELISTYRFPVHIITKSDLVLRDMDILDTIDKNAVRPAGLALDRGCIVSFSFSTMDEEVASLFEPGAPPPLLRLQALEQLSVAGFLTGISLMPLLPFISDTGENLHQMFRQAQKAGARYLMPATLSLYGSGRADSKTLVLEAVRKRYPQLLPRYEAYFKDSGEMPGFYRDAFYRKMQELCAQYGIPDRIVKSV